MYPRPTKCMPPIVHPTKCCTQFTSQEVVVPHIHPSHNTLVNHTNVKHVHYFPQTQSVVNETSNQQFFGGAQQYPTQVGGGGYPGQVASASYPGHKGCGQGSCHTKGAHQGPNSGYFR